MVIAAEKHRTNAERGEARRFPGIPLSSTARVYPGAPRMVQNPYLLPDTPIPRHRDLGSCLDVDRCSLIIERSAGSVVDVVANGSGNTILDHIVYDSFGSTVSQTYSANAILMGYQGYILDSITGLYYANARYYSPQLGRFISQYPSGFSAGDSNLYRFVGNHPTYATDPTGLYEGGSSFAPDFGANSLTFNTSVGSSPTSLTGSTSSAGSGGYTPVGGGAFNYTLPAGPTPGQSLAGINFGSQPSAASLLGGGGYASLGVSSPNNGMATSSEINAAAVAGTQAYLDSANAALANPNPFQVYGANASSSPTINMDQSAYRPSDFAQAFGNSLAQSGALPNPSIWGPQAQGLYNAGAERFWGGLQAGGGTIEAAAGLALGGVGTASELGSVGVTTPVSLPAMVGGSILAANGVDNAWAGLQTVWSGQPTQTYTQQAITATTGSPSVGVWGNVLIGMVGGNDAAAAENTIVRLPEGSFSISDWTGYPPTTPSGAAMPRPGGPFRLLPPAEYTVALAQKSATNGAIRRELPLWSSAGLDWHEIQPVKFGGSPTDLGNKIPLPRSFHQQEVTPWWNALQRRIEGEQ